MTPRTLPAILALALAALLPTAALAHGDVTPRHGGAVAMANDLGFELVATPGGAALYIQDHGKPLAPAGMSGKLTVLQGTRKTEAPLVPTGDRLEAKGVTLAPGAKVVAVVSTAPQKATTVRFTLK